MSSNPSIWTAISQVGTGLTLVAFIIAATSAFLRERLRHRQRQLETAREEDRPALVQALNDTFLVPSLPIDPAKLTSRQSYNLLLQQIRDRSRRFLIAAVVVVIIALLIAAVTTLAIQRARTAKSVEPPNSEAALVKVDKEDQRAPLMAGDVRVSYNSCAYATISSAGHLSEVPVTVIADVPRTHPIWVDYSIVFDITNKGASDLRIVNVYVRTLKWSELEQIVNYNACTGISPTREGFCIIEKYPRRYRVNLVKPHEYLRLAPGELETIELMLTALQEGKYDIVVELQYSMGGATGTTTIGPFSNLRFLDRDHIDQLPR
jgi:hypothetical protein